MSNLPFELLLALRYLRPKRTFVSIITLISIVGVALGVAVLIIVISVMNGFDHDLREKILGFNAHLTITKPGMTMTNYPAIEAIIATNRAVEGVSPFIAGPVLVETEGDTNRPTLQDAPMLRGADPATEAKISKLPDEILPGGSFDLSGRGLVVGTDFARNLGLNVGDRLSIYSYSEIKQMKAARDQHQDEAILPDDYEIRGIFDAGYYDYDARVIVCSLQSAQDLFGLEDSVHGLFVALKDPYQANAVSGQLEAALGGDYNATTWMEQSSSFLLAIEVEKNVMFFILFFIVLVAALCILNAQIMFVIQKTREIGMLKALGASRMQISGIFLFQSVIIGIIGVICGFGLGMLALTYRNGFLHFLRAMTGLNIFSADVYGFDKLPALIQPHDVAVICVGSFIICILGALLPAWRAGRLQPVEALRYE